jgi:cellobiose-specific phosphotransferase system component IIA
MIKNIMLGASLLLSVALGLSVIAQTDFKVIPLAYAQNITPKMQLEEGLKALKSGDNQGAMMHLNAADQALTSASDQSAKMHLNQGIQALKNGDNQGAMMHLNAADQALK